MSMFEKQLVEEAPDYIDGMERPEWIKGTVKSIRDEAAARGLATAHSTHGTLKIWDPTTGHIIWFQETTRVGCLEYLL